MFRWLFSRAYQKLYRNQKHNSVFFAHTYKTVSLDSYICVVNYHSLAKDFDQYFLDSGLLNDPIYMYKKMNLSCAFYRDYYQMYYTMVQYNNLLKVIEMGEKIVIRVGDPYLRRVLTVYRQRGFKNVEIYGRRYQILRNIASEVVKLCLNISTLFRHSVFFFSSKKSKMCAVHTSNNFGPTGKFDYRIGDVVTPLIKARNPILFLIRTNHGPLKIIKNHFLRDVPCIYTDSIIKFCEAIACCNPLLKKDGNNLKADLKSQVVFERLSHGLPGIRLAIMTLGYIFQKTNISVMFCPDSSERSILELAACRQRDIMTIGTQNGTEWDFFQVHKFVKPVSVGLEYMAHDKFGVWSEGWLQYFVRNSNVYSKENLHVSGFYRHKAKPYKALYGPNKKIDKILWLVENLTPVNEIFPYIEILIKNNFIIYLKVRPQQKDAGDLTAEKIMQKFGHQHFTIIDQPIEECVKDYDLALGCYTTALLDSGLGGVPVLILKTETWGDVFKLEFDQTVNRSYCRSPKELIDGIRDVPLEAIQNFINLYAPDPYLSGSEWVVREINNNLK
jgi:hypothetical protein